MPLTPLGKQLRAVLAGLRDVTCARNLHSSTRAVERSRTCPSRPNGRRLLHHGGRRRGEAAVSVQEEEYVPMTEEVRDEEINSSMSGRRAVHQREKSKKKPSGSEYRPFHHGQHASMRELKERAGPNSAQHWRLRMPTTESTLELAEQLHGLEESRQRAPTTLWERRRAVAQPLHPPVLDSQHAPAEDSRKATFRERGTHRGGLQIDFTNPNYKGVVDIISGQVVDILSDYFHLRESLGHDGTEAGRFFFPTQKQKDAIETAGCSNDDIEDWAKIMLNRNSLDAATAFAKKAQVAKPVTLPLFVLDMMLRRTYLSPQSFRLLLGHVDFILKAQRRRTNWRAYALFVRLCYHARKVWPASLDSISRVFLDNLSPIAREDTLCDPEKLHELTKMLNTAMCLVVLPTSIAPFKNNPHQEAALVRILQHMNSHSPTIQITREGYRAVILLQLAQRKTQKEQQWADLKALSWPPWKEERTAVDGLITSDDHGISKAAATLFRMREAGYGPEEWEQTAMIYAGWDIDRTPTIQTLTLLGTGGTRFNTGTAIWAGRINATRTAQEAWAAYLAYEEELAANNEQSPDQEVYEAILERLHREELRLIDRKLKPSDHGFDYMKDLGSRTEVIDSWPIFPGDVKEVAPLPPSIHLYTYTRTNAPTKHGFYKHMRRVGIVPRGHCLAFLVANADRLLQGLEYLAKSSERNIAAALIGLDREQDITQVHGKVFTGFIALLCRFSKVPIKQRSNRATVPLLDPNVSRHILKTRTFTRHTAVVHAICLVEWRRPMDMRPYNMVLQCLGHTSTHAQLRTGPLHADPNAPWDWQKSIPDTAEERRDEENRGAVTAHRLAWYTLSLMRASHLHLDIDGFRAICQITENTAIATWEILRKEECEEHSARKPRLWVHDAEAWVQSTSYMTKLKHEFRALVGDTDASTHRAADQNVENDNDVGDANTPDANTHLADDQNENNEAAVAGDHAILTHTLETPNFALLHTYIRALGWMADHDGLAATVRWMHAHREEIAERQKQDRNSAVMTLRTMCALRVFLERSWIPRRDGDGDSGEGDGDGAGGKEAGETASPSSPPRPRLENGLKRLRSPAPQALVDEVRSLVDSVDAWGGWPDDEAVEAYCKASEGRFARAL